MAVISSLGILTFLSLQLDFIIIIIIIKDFCIAQDR